jgi:undecaprenyl-diphosphatase
MAYGLHHASGMSIEPPTTTPPESTPVVVHPEPPPTVRRPVAARRTRLVLLSVTVLGVLFVGLALFLRQSRGTDVDLAVTRAIQRMDDPYFADLMIGLSALGYAPISWIVLGGAVVTLELAGFYREVPFVIATEGAGMLTASIKLLVERPRPADDSIRVASALLDYSYPSGHVVGYVVLYGLLFFLVYTLFRRSWRRTLALAVLGSLVALIGVSRIYLGHHWASDVLGGYALGTAYLLILIEAYHLLVIRSGPSRQTTAHPPPPLPLAGKGAGG